MFEEVNQKWWRNHMKSEVFKWIQTKATTETWRWAGDINEALPDWICIHTYFFFSPFFLFFIIKFPASSYEHMPSWWSAAQSTSNHTLRLELCERCNDVNGILKHNDRYIYEGKIIWIAIWNATHKKSQANINSQQSKKRNAIHIYTYFCVGKHSVFISFGVFVCVCIFIIRSTSTSDPICPLNTMST